MFRHDAMNGCVRIAFVALTLAACAARGGHSQRAGHGVRTSVAVRATSHAGVTGRLFRRGLFESFELLPADPDVRRFIERGHPAVVRAGVIRTGPHAFADPLVAVIRRSNGWRFVTDVEVWDAPTFVDRPTLVASEPTRRVGAGAGRLAILSADGIIGLPPPRLGTIVDAAFSDDHRGVAVFEGAGVRRTEDGGATWVAVPFADDASLRVVATTTTRYVRGVVRAIAIEADGIASSVTFDVVPHIASADDETLAGFERPAPLAPTHVYVGALAPRSIARALSEAGEHRVWEYDIDADQIVPGSEGPEACDQASYFFAGRWHARCHATDGASLLVAREPHGRWRERLRFWPCGAASGQCSGAADGSHVLCSGTNVPNTPCPPGLVLIEIDAHDLAVRRVVGDGIRTWSFLGYLGSEPVFIDDHERWERLQIIVGRGAPHPMVASPAVGLRVDHRSIRLGDDGLIWAFVAPTGTQSWRLAEGRPGGEFRFRDDPPIDDAGPTAVPASERDRPALCDEGIALSGSSGGQLRVLRRGGPGWESIATLGADDITRAALENYGRSTSRSSALDCRSLGRLDLGDEAVGYWPMRASRLGPLGARRVDPETPPAWNCVAVGDLPRSPERFAAIVGDPVSFAGGWGRRRGSWIDIHWYRSTDGALRTPRHAHVQWRAALQGDTQDTTAEWVLLAATSTRVVAMQRPDRNSLRGPWRVVEFRANATPRQLATLPGFDGPDEPDAFLGRELRAYSLHASVQLARVFTSAPLRNVRNFGIAAVYIEWRDGAVRAQLVPFGRVPGERAGVYVLDSQSGIVRVRADGRVVGGPPDSIQRVLAQRIELRACGASARGEFVLPSTRSRDRLAPPDIEEHYGLDGDTLCLRRLWEDDGRLLVERVGDEWRGEESADAGRTVTCVPTTTAR